MVQPSAVTVVFDELLFIDMDLPGEISDTSTGPQRNY